MNDFGTGLIIGTFFGNIFGVALMALLSAGGDDEWA